MEVIEFLTKIGVSVDDPSTWIVIILTVIGLIPKSWRGMVWIYKHICGKVNKRLSRWKRKKLDKRKSLAIEMYHLAEDEMMDALGVRIHTLEENLNMLILESNSEKNENKKFRVMMDTELCKIKDIMTQILKTKKEE